MNMKYISSILTMFFLCLVSCNNIEEITDSGKNNDKVCIFTEFSDKTVNTRSVSIPATHQLRCIIEVWTKGNNQTLSFRKEVAVEAGILPQFEFSLPNGDYECLMWADCIKKEAEAVRVETSNGLTYEHFADDFYRTDNLHQITIKDKTARNLFDTDLCDAFFASVDLEKGSGNLSETLKLKRPFAKLIVKENELDKLAQLKKMKVIYTVPAGFNVSVGEPLPGTLRAEYEKIFTEYDTSVLFTNYIFSYAGNEGKLGKMSLLFTTDDEISYEVAEGVIPLRRNEKISASGNLIASGTIKPDEPIGDPQIGDYFFIDGTWGASLTDENKDKCIGIIFATGQQEGDDISNYGEAGKEKEILGYVMALKNMDDNKRPMFYDGAGPEQQFAKIEGAELEAEKEKFNGYTNTKNFLGSDLYKDNAGVYLALTIFDTWEKTASKPQKNASDWYIPSFNQLIKMVGGCYGYSNFGNKSVYTKHIEKNTILETALKNAIESGVAEDFVRDQRERPVQCSTICEKADVLVVRYNPTKPQEITVKTESGQGHIRPALTILK